MTPETPNSAAPDGRFEPMALRDRLVDLGRAHGLAEVGVCDASPFDAERRILEQRRNEGLNADMAFTYRNPARSTDPSRALAGARSMIVGAYRYDTSLPSAPSRAAARVARYATEDHYARLRAALGAIARELRDHGHRALVVADDNAMVDRAVAVRAGIGWYGKNSNVLLPGQGSWFVLGSVITDAALSPTGAPLEDGCGSCTRCIEGCPTAAIVAPGVVDARRCLAWHLQATGDFPREFRAALGDRIYGCDECQEVCPPSRRADARTPGLADPSDAELAPSTTPSTTPSNAPGTWVDLDWLLSAQDEELMATVGRWYIPKRESRYVRRNALVVLGNSVDLVDTDARPSDPAAPRIDPDRIAGLLAVYLDGEDEMLAAHATWAALRLGRIDLVEAPGRGDRPAIAAEVAAHASFVAADDGLATGPDVLRLAGSGDDGAT